MTILRLALAVLSSVMVVYVDCVEDDVDTIMPRLYRELHKYSCKTEAMIDAIHMAKRNDVSLQPLLFESADSGLLHCVTVLVDHGVDLQASNEFGHSPLVLARLGRHDAVERLILDRLRVRPTWQVPQPPEQLATWVERHSGFIEKFVQSGTGESMTESEVQQHFPELADIEWTTILAHIHAESARYAEERKPY